jgi:pyruvate,orthophosphate dikinase
VAAALAGKVITVDGAAGEVREGALELSAWSESDSPDLLELADLARRVSPLRAYAVGDHPVLENNSEEAIRATIAAGNTDVVSSSPLITMLTALRLGTD